MPGPPFRIPSPSLALPVSFSACCANQNLPKAMPKLAQDAFRHLRIQMHDETGYTSNKNQCCAGLAEASRRLSTVLKALEALTSTWMTWKRC